MRSQLLREFCLSRSKQWYIVRGQSPFYSFRSDVNPVFKWFLMSTIPQNIKEHQRPFFATRQFCIFIQVNCLHSYKPQAKKLFFKPRYFRIYCRYSLKSRYCCKFSSSFIFIFKKYSWSYQAFKQEKTHKIQ